MKRIVQGVLIAIVITINLSFIGLNVENEFSAVTITSNDKDPGSMH